MRLDNNNLQTVLMALGDQVALRTTETIAIVVCGGSALQALGLVQRTTRDVDVLAVANPPESAGVPTLLTAEPLPQPLREAAKAVAQDFNLPDDWLNTGPTDLLREGLPEGCEQRLHRFSYGDRLTIYFIDRLDQICFKTYAAINGDTQRHFLDLRALRPTTDEMITAARWTVTQDALPEYPDMVRDFLRKAGYPDAADRL